ncbi:ferrous iron transport protein B [Desulfovibrio inopinatus]|uniref:ferrous iron transport protein B n=1 Tax=Desulfovibrio inopinatus TaxID=102109 RepID=UPI0004085CAA|nr:ferrous iron transport protein B [Desulfovibrio inopinatus]
MSTLFTMALAGNPNAGKSTLFNALTGSRQHVGNYPGITVDKKEGTAKSAAGDIHVVDLPGTYSLTAYSLEEVVARNFLADCRPEVVVDVANAGALERNLYLAVQLLEMGIPVVLGLNMMDEAEKKGLTIDADRLSHLMDLPVVKLVARKGLGVSELLEEAITVARSRQGDWQPLTISYGPDLDEALLDMTSQIEAKGFLTDRYPARWIALKYMESDDEIKRQGKLVDAELAADLEARVARETEHCRATLSTYPEAVIADYRYGYIASMLKKGVLQRDTREERIAMSDRMDLILTHKFAGPLIMLGVLYMVYQITFSLGEIPMGWTEAFFSWLGDVVVALVPPGLLQSLIISGIIDGAGGVLGFVPLILLIFFLIAFLEDSGYMARVAYMLDRVFRTFGLHGCSVMPFLISGGIAGGCAVPGVMAARTLRSPKERLATILTAPFMTCGAKLPVFILLTGVFFPKYQAQAMFGVTLVAWSVALLVAKVLRMTIIRGPSTPFVMELPPYRLPTMRGLLIHTWERTWQYIKKAGTIIVAISILIWACMTFPSPSAEELQAFETRSVAISTEMAALSGQTDDQSRQTLNDLQRQLDTIEKEQSGFALRRSLAGRLGVALESVSWLAGFDWQTNIALTGGIAAKEVIVSTLGTAYSLGGGGPEVTDSLAERLAHDSSWTVVKAMSLMVFILLYAPCFVTIVVMAKETSWRWAAFSAVFNTVLAFTLATLIYQVGIMI